VAGGLRSDRTCDRLAIMRPLDLAYLVAALVTSPVWLYRMVRTGRIRTDWSARFGRGASIPRTERPRLLIHAVSVGEVNALRVLIPYLAAGDDAPEIVLSVTTDTGIGQARALFGDTCSVVRFPFDFSRSVRRLLDRTQPDVVACVELELWPSFMRLCEQRGIPVAVINGRLSARSARRYGWVRPFVRRSFARLAVAAVQDETIADRFRSLGTAPDRVVVTGTMKWDTAQIEDEVEGADALAAAMGIDRQRPLVVGGSTAPDEHALLNDAVPTGTQLLCAPRRPEWCDGAAEALPGCRRRTDPRPAKTGGDRFLLDTIGELRAAYALADVVVVGRSFGRLYGSDMMEPIALGKPTIVGPAVSDFQTTMETLLAGDGIRQVDRAGLAAAIESLLSDAVAARELAARGRAVIQAQQGASGRNAVLLRSLFEA